MGSELRMKFKVTIDDLLDRLEKVKKTRNGWMARCPAHIDKTPSLAISEDEDGKILLYCFAGCSFIQIYQALEVNEREHKQFHDSPKANEIPRGKIINEYDYVDEQNKLLFQVVRFEQKRFALRQPDNQGGWNWSKEGIKKVSYRLPDLLQAKENNYLVFVCEGEKDADNLLYKLGLIATTTALGSNNWDKEYSKYFEGLDIILLPDNDNSGRRYANDVATSLYDTAKSLRIINLPDLQEKEDVSDWIEKGGDKEKLLTLVSSISPLASIDSLQTDTGNKATKMFVVKTARQWIEEAKNKPVPKMLFGTLWFEGEICILFADTNLGKSILAVQIADSLTNGKPIYPFHLETPPQKVLYFDFELSDRQFVNRYSEQENGCYTNVYDFNENFLRVEINRDNDSFDFLNDYENSIIKSIEKTIEENDAKILIVDNITYFKSDNEKAKDALPLMKQLKTIKEKYQISILALAHTPKRAFAKPLTKDDLQGSKMIINFADSAFAIGDSYQAKNLRYIKQIKERNAGKVYDSENVCVCEVGKSGNFLGFNFLNYGIEAEHLIVKSNISKIEEAEIVQQFIKEGKTQREISENTGFSLGKVNTLSKVATKTGSTQLENIQNVQPFYDLNKMNILKNDAEISMNE